MRTAATDLSIESKELMEKQRGFQLINPTEKWFPGIMEIREQYASWDWRFGKTPKFSVEKLVQLKSDAKTTDAKLNVDITEVKYQFYTYFFFIIVIFDVFHKFLQGRIEDISITLPNNEPIPVVSKLKGQEYTEDNLHGIIEALKGVKSENVKQAINNSA